jgi:hypothetical protein
VSSSVKGQQQNYVRLVGVTVCGDVSVLAGACAVLCVCGVCGRCAYGVCGG